MLAEDLICIKIVDGTILQSEIRCADFSLEIQG